MATRDSYEVQLATRMQLILDQPMSDITTKLVNHDFEGDFFKIGDTVSIVKPDVSSVTVSVGTAKTDNRLAATDLDFSKTTLQIDKSARYAFLVSDITKEEGKWNYESGGLDAAAQEIRKQHNIEICDLLVNDVNVQKIGTPQNPITIQNVDDLYEKVIVPMYLALYEKGAITVDGQVTFGANPQEAKATTAGIFVPTDAFGLLLQSTYLTDRATTAADDKVATANIKQILGMDVAIEPALKQTAARHITLQNAKDNGVMCVVAGTRNCITKAGKVLPPDRFMSHTRFAEEFHGLEIYGQKVFEPDAAIVAYIEI